MTDFESLPLGTGADLTRLNDLAEVGWIDEQNTIAHSTITHTAATVYKKHCVFEKQLKKQQKKN